MGLVVKNLPASSGESRRHGFDSWVGKIPGGGNGTPLQYSCLGDPLDRGAWCLIVHSVTKSWTRQRQNAYTRMHGILGKVFYFPSWGLWSKREYMF